MTNMIVMGEYRLLLFLAISQKLKILWHFEVLANTGPGAGNFKMLLLLQFSSDVSQTLNEDFGYQAITFVGNRPSFKNLVEL